MPLFIIERPPLISAEGASLHQEEATALLLRLLLLTSHLQQQQQQQQQQLLLLLLHPMCRGFRAVPVALQGPTPWRPLASPPPSWNFRCFKKTISSISAASAAATATRMAVWVSRGPWSPFLALCPLGAPPMPLVASMMCGGFRPWGPLGAPRPRRGGACPLAKSGEDASDPRRGPLGPCSLLRTGGLGHELPVTVRLLLLLLLLVKAALSHPPVAAAATAACSSSSSICRRPSLLWDAYDAYGISFRVGDSSSRSSSSTSSCCRCYRTTTISNGCCSSRKRDSSSPSCGGWRRAARATPSSLGAPRGLLGGLF